MSGDGSSYQVDFSSGPVDMQVVFCQPRVSQDNVVSFPEVQHEEVLCSVLPINSEMKFDLVMDHPSRVVGSVHISSIHRLSEFLQWPFHPPSQVEVDATDCCSTVDQGSGLSDFSVFHLVKSHRDSDCPCRCCYKYRLNICGKRRC